MPEPERPIRRSLRLKDYDYSQQGGYFVTIVTQLRLSFFGEIPKQEMVLNAAGEMIHAIWLSLPGRFPQIEIDVFQVMPNHFHGILFIHPNQHGRVGAGFIPAQIGGDLDAGERATTRVAPTENEVTPRNTPILGDIIGAFKSISTHEYILGVKKLGWKPFEKRLWQRNYYEHILRGQADYESKSGYIIANPENWEKDEENARKRYGFHEM